MKVNVPMFYWKTLSKNCLDLAAQMYNGQASLCTIMLSCVKSHSPTIPIDSSDRP